jgi:hypothetical protein
MMGGDTTALVTRGRWLGYEGELGSMSDKEDEVASHRGGTTLVGWRVRMAMVALEVVVELR